MAKSTTQRWWIGQITCIATKTLLVPAETRREAISVLNSAEREGAEAVDVHYGQERSARIIREDKAFRIKVES